ncbi:MAG: glycosyltransferase family 9 protein [Gemmatimonadetes bacterium]|nr:glycosyltransferase family 9 protein [Gemmatimonadota bacterium]
MDQDPGLGSLGGDRHVAVASPPVLASTPAPHPVHEPICHQARPQGDIPEESRHEGHLNRRLLIPTHATPSIIPPHTRRILLVRLSARGDLVFASPLAAAIKRTFPHVHLAWVAEERTADVIAHNPHVDELIVWERAGWKRLFKERRWGELSDAVRSFVTELRARRFDVAIDVQGLLRSGVVAFLSGAPMRIGLASREGSGLLMTRVLPLGGNKRAISSEYENLARQLGLRVDPFTIEIPPSEQDRSGARALTGGGGGYIVVAPFTTRYFKHWFEDRWSGLLERLGPATGRRVVMLGGPADRAAAERILGPITSDVLDLVGRTALGEAAAVVEGADAVIGVDTGLTHMAHGYERPSVLLLGSNTPYLEPPLPVSRILHSGRDCSPCRGKLTCEGRIDCMRDLSVDHVLDAVQEVLAPTVPVRGGAAPE